MSDEINTNHRRTQLAKVYGLLLQQRHKRHLLKSKSNKLIALRQTVANPNEMVAAKEVKVGRFSREQLTKDSSE